MTIDALLVLFGALCFLFGFPYWAYVSTGKGWAGMLMFLGCAFILMMALK